MTSAATALAPDPSEQTVETGSDVLPFLNSAATIDWSDPRAIGLACYFKDSLHPEVEGYFQRLNAHAASSPFVSNKGLYYEHARLAQSEIIEHDGSEQPVPNNVHLQVLSDDSTLIDDVLSHDVDWSTVRYFQIREHADLSQEI